MEHQRLAFLEARDGKAGAKAFAVQDLRLYRTAISLHRGIGADRDRRKLLVASCNCFRRYVLEMT